MKTNRPRFWKRALLLAVPLVLFAFTAEHNSWRPRVIGPVKPNCQIEAIQFSPDGRYLSLAPFSDDYLVNLDLHPTFYETGSGRIFELEDINVLSFPYTTLAFIGKDRFMLERRIYSFPDGKLLAHCPPNMAVLSGLSDGKTLLLVPEKQKILEGQIHRREREPELFAWDFRSGQMTSIIPTLPPRPTNNTMRSFQLLPDGRTLVISDQMPSDIEEKQLGDDSWGMRFWHMEKQKLVFHIPGRRTSIMYVAGDFCIVWDAGGETLWNYKTGQRLHKYPDSYPGFSSALWPDGSQIAYFSLGQKADIDLVETRSGKITRTVDSRDHIVQNLEFSPDGRTLATLSNDGIVRLWRVK